MNGACCSPSLPSDRGPLAASGELESSPLPLPPGLQLVPLRGGRLLMGSEDGIFPADGEAPVRAVTLSPFAISAHAVTNAQFAAFATATGYRTDAERTGSSFVFAGFVPRGSRDAVRGPVAGTPWWVEVAGASWQIRGGSYLCHESYCFRYCVAARSFNTPDSSTAHTGFRVARSLPD